MSRIALFGVVSASALTLALSGCGSAQSGESSTPTSAASAADGAPAEGGTNVIATTSIWGSIAGQVAECAGGSVTTLMPVGTDPHDFTPSSEQVAQMVGADVVIANGLGLEEGLESALQTAQAEGATVLELAPQLNPIPLTGDAAGHAEEEQAEPPAEEEGHSESGEDPHVWLDAGRAAQAATLIGDTLAEATGNAAYASCGATVSDELTALNAEITQILAAVPADKRGLVTDHDALGYFADAYDFQVLGVVIPGGSTLGGASSADIAALAAEVKESGTNAIFANTANPSALVDALAAEAGQVEVVELYVDSLGEPGSEAATYQGMMRTDAQRISAALAD